MANILEEVQTYVAGKLSAESQLSTCPFIIENRKDIEYEIKNALGKQGIVGIVMTPKALYAGKFEDQSLVWQLDELEIDIIENVTVNRGKRGLSSYITGQDAAMKAFESLCPLSGSNEGQFSPVSYEEGEDNGLLVNKCVFKCLVHGGAEEPGPSPEPLQFSVVKLFAEEPPLSVTRKDGWIWPSGDQFILWSHNSPNALGDVTTQQMSAFVTQKLGNYYTKNETSSAIEISTALESYYTKNETSSNVEVSAALDSKADKTQLDSYYTKNETSSAAQINAAVAQLCSYTDSQVSSKAAKSELSNYLPLSGGTVSGTTEFNDVVKFNSYIEVSGVTESLQFNLVDWDEDQAVVARLLSSGTVQLEDSAGHRAVLSVRDGGTVAYVEDILEQVSSYYTKSETSSNVELDAEFDTKADLSAIPTKTSDLSNDSGFITSADIITKRDISDMTVKGVPQNANFQSWFTIKYVTTTENAWYYDEGRWESGATTRVYATSTSQVFELQRLIESQWTSLGTFSLDSNFEAAVTYDGVTYSITGYVGDLVASSELPTKTSDLSNDSGFITSADVPTKTSQLSNDSGFITEASYIEDANENRINADRSVSYIGDGTPYWQMVSKFSTIPKTINFEGTKTDSSYIQTGDLQDGDVKAHLTYTIDKWQIEIQTWDAGLQEWGASQFFSDTQSSESATELNFGTPYIGSCVWTTPKVVVNDNLVTESSLSSIIANLEARIAALEGN